MSATEITPEKALAEFRGNFRLDELTLHESDHWLLSLRPEQMTLGAMVLSVRSGKMAFDDLSDQEYIDMGRQLAVAERLAKSSLGAVRINAVCLMMKDPIVHFHILPRFDHLVSRHGVEWQDEFWPGPPVFGPAPTSDAVLRAVHADLLQGVEHIS